MFLLNTAVLKTNYFFHMEKTTSCNQALEAPGFEPTAEE